MPRRPRLFVPGGFYHTTLRGNHQQSLFADAADRLILDRIVAAALGPARARLHAYCWMANHLHMLVQVADRPLGVLIQRIGTRFARAVQRRVPTTGHLFQNRYDARLIDVDAYFQEVLRYIHLNPVRAGLVDRPDGYPWSSHLVYLGLREAPWVTVDFGLSLFGRSIERARRAYQRFVWEGTGVSSDATPLKGNPQEPRILGDDRFLGSLPVANRPAPRISLHELADVVCREFNVPITDVRSSSRCAALRVRETLAARAVEAGIASVSDVARFLNRSAAAVSRAVTRHRENNSAP